ncbi:MAG: glycosyltransferase family 4 protein [Thermoanaerobaculia bacterium]
MKSRALFWVHDPAAPSFRHRLAVHIPALESEGFACEVETFPRRRYGLRVLERLARAREFDLLVVAKFKLEIGERQAVRRAAKKIAYDFDDAIYYSKPARPGDEPGRGARRVRKFRAMCSITDVVTAGNETLAAAARPFARRVEVVPTPIDLSSYGQPRRASNGLRLVWIGLPGNLPYLDILRGPLATLGAEFPDLSLKVISERPPAGVPIPVEFVPWSSSTEAGELAACDIGVMPLSDDGWTRGKGGFKLLQYMAARLPAVASPVGVNREIVVQGETGFLAPDAAAWETSLRALLRDPGRAREMGLAGRRRVEERYERSIVSRRLARIYGSL